VSNEVTIKIVRGHPVGGDAFQDAVHQVLGDALEGAGAALVASGMQATPVRTGNLRRSWAKESPSWRGLLGRMRVGPGAVYAHRVNTVGRSAGYIQDGVEAGIDTAISRMEGGVRALVRHMWKND